MSRQEFTDKWRHELCGLLADAFVSGERGAPLAAKMRQDFRRIDEILYQIYHELTTQQAPAPNGRGGNPTNLKVAP